MGTTTILGDVYQTVVMPDGKEWLAENFRYTGVGQWYLNASTDNGDGRLYNASDLAAIKALLTDGWRIPVCLTDTVPMVTATEQPIPIRAWPACDYDTRWTYPDRATNETGFSIRPNEWYSGFYSAWSPGANPYASFWHEVTGGWRAFEVNEDSSKNATFVGYSTDAPVGGTFLSDKFPIRLVREPVPQEPLDRAESVSYDYRLALDWDAALDGTPICIDDGATYDYIESTITMRLTPTELAEWEASWEGNGIVYPPGTGRLLGPTVDHSGADIACTLRDFVIDGPADSAMTLFDVTARLHYNGLGAPSAGSPSPLMDRGVPYHSIRPGYRSIILDSGGAAVVPYSGASTRITKWYSSGLTLSEAQDAINWLRTLRGSQYAWTVGGTGFPFGPSESQSNTIWIPAWKCLRESNFTYGFELEIVLDG